MPAEESAYSDDVARHINKLEAQGGDVVQARDVHGGVHFHDAHERPEVIPRQLPRPAQSFVNRAAEFSYLSEVTARDGDGSLVIVITGTAGVGKTSLAIRWAHRVHKRFPGGQLYANLRGYDPGPPATAEHVLGRFLRALGVPGRAVPSDAEERASLYRSILSGQRVLIVLDNASAVGQVRPLLPGAPGCLVVVTSRSRLSALVAREGAHVLRLDLLREDDAVALLRAATEGRRADDRPADLVELAGLCARLPLALRIAAERAACRPLMLLPELIADLRDESGLWDALNLDSDDDAEAVRTVFAWSYRALPEPAATMFRLLGLHPGNEFGPSAAAVLAGVNVRQARHDLDALVGAHLIEDSAPGRYQFHDLMRHYAIDQVRQLETEQVRADTQRRVLEWYLYTADKARHLVSPFSRSVPTDSVAEVVPLAFDGYEQALRWYQTEAANVLMCVSVAADTGQHEIAWRLAVTLRGFYMHHNAFDDWITTARIGVESAARMGDRVGEAETLDSLGMAYFQSRLLDDAESCHRLALNIRQALGNEFGVAVSVNALGQLDLRHRRLEDAAARFRQGASIFGNLGERRWQALLRGNLAEVLCERGDFDTAAEMIQSLLPQFRELGDRFGEGDALFRLAWAFRGVSRLDEARTAIENALVIAAEDDNNVWRAHWLTERARIELAQIRPAEALTSSQQAAVIQRRLGDRSREASAFDCTGRAYQQLDRHDDAAKFHRRAASVHRDLGDWWQLANALDHLARALDHNGEANEARRSRQEAVSMLAKFSDPPAVAMRNQLTWILAAP